MQQSVMRYKYGPIAEAAGVSIATVSRVMRGDKGPSDETRQRVMRAAQQVGYFALAFHPRTELLLHGDDGAQQRPFYSQLYASIAQRARHLKIRVSLVRSPHDPAPYGVVVLGQSAFDQMPPNAYPDAPVVLVDIEDEHHDRVLTDNEHSGMLAVRHLCETVPPEKGIAVIIGPHHNYSFRERGRGATEALRRMKRLSPHLIHPLNHEHTLGFQEGQRAAHWVLEHLSEIGGVFIGNDASALGLMQSLLAAGVRIPEDLKIIGHDDEMGAAQAPVPLSTIRVDYRSMGQWAVDLVLHRLMDPERPAVRVMLSGTLIERASTGF